MERPSLAGTLEQEWGDDALKAQSNGNEAAMAKLQWKRSCHVEAAMEPSCWKGTMLEWRRETETEKASTSESNNRETETEKP